jgi:hypothetical protein
MIHLVNIRKRPDNSRYIKIFVMNRPEIIRKLNAVRSARPAIRITSTLLIAFAWAMSFTAYAQEFLSVESYPDGRPTAKFRLDAEDSGRIFRHGSGPNDCDKYGSQELAAAWPGLQFRKAWYA